MDPTERFIALDLETTGLDLKTEEIIEIGLVLFEDGKVIDTLSGTVNPGKRVSDNVLILTGIKQEELDKSPPIEQLLPEIKEFTKDLPLVGHNVSFDTDFLKKHLSILNPTYDTLRLSRIYLPFVDSHKLAYVAEYMGIVYGEAHRAEEDARMSGEILMGLYRIMCSVDPEILKKQIDAMKGKYQEALLLENALKRSLKKGLNRNPYPYDIPVNFRMRRGKEKGKLLPKVSDYFKQKDLEKRKSQVEMAELVQSALINDEFLIVEASAGTGKSLAYLVPAIPYARNSEEPIYISSYTKNLQQQLFNNDIPKAEEITHFGVNTLMRKGKSNYLCLLKLRTLFGDMDAISLSALYFWASITRTGDLSEVSYLEREINKGLINMDETCRKEACPYYDSCFYYNMEKHIKEADLILVNHSLFFTRNPNAEKVIFDEAHEIEKAATQGYALTVSLAEVQSALKNIKREVKGELGREAEKLLKAAEESFQKVGKSFRDANEYSVGFYKDSQLLPLRALSEQLNDFISVITSLDQDISETVGRLREFVNNLRILIQQEEKDRVFYYELRYRQRPSSLELIGAPLDVGSYLEEYLYPTLSSLVMTSATLSVGESFDFLNYILGLMRFGDRLKEISLPDTYNFSEQALTVVPKFLSLPDESGYIGEVSRFITDIILPLNKGTLVLFTSYNHMKGVYQEIKKDFEDGGRELLIQGFGKSRARLLSLFKGNENSVLLGTGSFWQGVDVPGKALEIVVIEKLPFPNPADPFIFAKSAYFENKDLGGFSSYILPLAVLRFKQGFGRLIRSTHDMGMIFVLDKRVVNKWYGSVFLDSLPTNVSTVNSTFEASEAVRAWFEEGRIYTSDYVEDDWQGF
jgi:ATP-dependent DNA helicase DinG